MFNHGKKQSEESTAEKSAEPTKSTESAESTKEKQAAGTAQLITHKKYSRFYLLYFTYFGKKY